MGGRDVRLMVVLEEGDVSEEATMICNTRTCDSLGWKTLMKAMKRWFRPDRRVDE
jgi:hypothetical protein